MNKNDLFRPIKIFKNLPKIWIHLYMTRNGTEIANLNSIDFKGSLEVKHNFFESFYEKLGKN